MSATLTLFERWKAAKGITSDRQALKALGLSPGAAVHWKAGREAEADVIERMALDVKDDPAMWAALAMKGRTKGEVSRAWARMARKLGAAAAIAGFALCVVHGSETVALTIAYVMALPTNTYYVLAAFGFALAALTWRLPTHKEA